MLNKEKDTPCLSRVVNAQWTDLRRFFHRGVPTGVEPLTEPVSQNYLDVSSHPQRLVHRPLAAVHLASVILQSHVCFGGPE